MPRHQTLLLTILLFSIFLLQNTSADRREASSNLFDDHLPSERQTPSKSISDQLLLINPAETQQIPEKYPPPTQDSSNQKGWFGKLKSKAKDSLKNAKEAIYSHIPESITEHAHNIGDKAKIFSHTVTSQAERIGHKAEQIYETVSHKLSNEIKHTTHQPSEEIYLAADFIDQDEKGNEMPLPEKTGDKLHPSTSGASPEEKKGIFGTFRQKISDVSNSVKNKVKYASISKSFSNKFKSIQEKTENLIHTPSRTFSSLGQHIQSIPQKISKKFSDMTQSSNNSTEKTGSWFSRSFERVTQKIKQVIPSTTIPFKEKITSAFQGIKGQIFTPISNLFSGAKDSISRFGSSAKGKFTGAFDKIKQAFPTAIPFKEKISSAFQGIKDRAISPGLNFFKGARDSISRFGSSAKGKFIGVFDKIKQTIPATIHFQEKIGSVYHGTKDSISRFGSSAKEKLTQTFDFVSPKILAPVYGIMNFGSWMWNLMAWRKLLYWVVGIVIGCLFLKVFLFLLPFVQMTVSILKTPFQAFFMLTSLFKQFYPTENPENGSQRQKNEPAVAEVKNKVKHPKERDRSYYRYSSSQEEWRRASHHELHEPTRPRDLDSEQVRRRFEDAQENEERYYNYYRCYGCNKQWENVTIGKGPVQECRTEGCKYSFGPYHQIPLLNNKQKKEEFDKVKSE